MKEIGVSSPRSSGGHLSSPHLQSKQSVALTKGNKNGAGERRSRRQKNYHQIHQKEMRGKRELYPSLPSELLREIEGFRGFSGELGRRQLSL